MFWGGVVFAGIMVPLVVAFLVRGMLITNSLLGAMTVGLISALIGGVSIRSLMYILGSEYDLIL